MDIHATITQLTTDESQMPLTRIGQGCCGTVWTDLDHKAQDECRLVIKREDGGPGRSLLMEYRVHKHLLRTLQSNQHANRITKFRVNIPFSEGLLGNDSPNWPRILPRLPPNFEPCNALVNERIPSMPDHVRTVLSRTYHPEIVSGVAASSEYCLVRPYLGRRRHRPQSTTRARPSQLLVFSLRNFPLHADQIEQLGLPAEPYAIAMADALAFFHWTAKLDGNDVEFVLAPARSPNFTKSNPGIGIVDFESEVFGSHTMWALDFDCCRDMPMDETGIKQAARSFLRNDPFYPRPGGTNVSDQRLWHIFQSRFLETSSLILSEDAESVRQLPAMLVEEIIRTHAENRGHNA